jgi:riboflavin biosynthesis pyrimidine reductase
VCPHPCACSKDLVNVTRGVDSYVSAGLLDVRSIVQAAKAQLFDRVLVGAGVEEVRNILESGGIVDSVVDLQQKDK